MTITMNSFCFGEILPAIVNWFFVDIIGTQKNDWGFHTDVVDTLMEVALEKGRKLHDSGDNNCVFSESSRRLNCKDDPILKDTDDREMKLTNTRDYQIGVQLRSIHTLFPESGFSVYFESEMREVDRLSYEQDIT